MPLFAVTKQAKAGGSAMWIAEVRQQLTGPFVIEKFPDIYQTC
jgi:hypothetical protein